MPGELLSYTSLEDIRAEHLRQIGDDADSNMEILAEESILFWANRIQKMVWDAPWSQTIIGQNVINPNMKGWSFAEDERKVDTVVPTAINNAAGVSVGATSITVDDASGFPNSSEKFVIIDSTGAYEVASRTGSNLTTSLTGVTGVNSAWDDGDEIVRLYNLPSDFAKMKKEPQVNDYPFQEVSEDPQDGEFAVRDGALWFHKGMGIQTVSYVYLKKYEDLAAITEDMKIPTGFDMFMIHMLNARFAKWNGNPQVDIDREELEASNQLKMRMGYDVQSSNRRIRLLRKRPRSDSDTFYQTHTTDY